MKRFTVYKYLQPGRGDQSLGYVCQSHGLGAQEHRGLKELAAAIMEVRRGLPQVDYFIENDVPADIVWKALEKCPTRYSKLHDGELDTLMQYLCRL